VEDEREMARLVELHLRHAGCDVQLAHDGPSGLELAAAGGFDCIVLDLMLPGLDGLDLCQRLREKPDYTPILMLTARSSEGDRVLGLEVGADDYLTKPFSIRELVARVRAIFRRVDVLAPAGDCGTIVAGGLVIEPAKRRVTLDSRPLQLTAKEFDLLVHFSRHPGRVFSRSELLDHVWGYSYAGYEHTVNSHINRLRSKIEECPTRPHYVQTVWGVGYKFLDPDDPPPHPS
jgi:DNA-binding response OmpR family regulator